MRFRTRARSPLLGALRSAIDRAAARGKTLYQYVAFLGMSYAFFSTNQGALWAKLHDWDTAGPLIDWRRMLYSRTCGAAAWAVLSQFSVFRHSSGFSLAIPRHRPWIFYTWSICHCAFMPPVCALLACGCPIWNRPMLSLSFRRRWVHCNALQDKLNTFLRWVPASLAVAVPCDLPRRYHHEVDDRVHVRSDDLWVLDPLYLGSTLVSIRQPTTERPF